MGKPFVACREPEPPSPLFSPDVSKQNGKLDAAGATLKLSTESDALQAAESYFQQVRESLSRNSNGNHGPPKTLYESLLEEVQGEPTGLVPMQHRKSLGELLQLAESKLPSELESRVSPGEGDMNELEASRSEFSLDDSYTSPPQSMFSPPPELGSPFSSAQANFDVETPSDFSLDDSDIGPDESMGLPLMGPISDRGTQQNEMLVQGLNFAKGAGVSSQSLDGDGRPESGPQGSQNSLASGEQIEGVEQNGQDTVSKLEFEWGSVLRKSARSLDSLSHDSFKTSRSDGIGSTNSRYSLSDEAISERAAAWGNGVARLVLKNSSRESTPRTSTGSSVSDGLSYGQKVPGVSKHVKDALTSFQLAFVVCDVIDPEKPVLFASAGFFDMTGYSPEEVIGRNCRFLQGVDTDANEIARIRTALKNGETYSGTILNYKKNGSPFWNLLTLSPITDDKGVVIKYMGMQAEVKRNSMTARRKKTALDTNYGNHLPRLVSHSITEEPSQPSNSQSKRSEREDDVPIFTLPSTSRVTATQDSNGRSQGSKRYSLTYGLHGRISHGRSRSVELGQGRPVIGGSERHSMQSERKRSGLAPQQRPAKSGSARPFYWLLTAARILEDEVHQLGFGNQNSAEEHTKTTTRREERKSGLKSKIKMSRVAEGVFGLIRKLERKVFKRKSRAPIPSNRVNAYNSDSDLEIDDFQDIGNIHDLFSDLQDPLNSERQESRCESMPNINYSNRGGSFSNLVMQADLRARSSRYFPSLTADRSDRRTSVSGTNEFLLDRKQFCIVHE